LSWLVQGEWREERGSGKEGKKGIITAQEG
jgi:hypothetical protein